VELARLSVARLSVGGEAERVDELAVAMTASPRICSRYSGWLRFPQAHGRALLQGSVQRRENLIIINCLWGICGTQYCAVVLSRDKCNGRL
jgi:hypothetical protein